MQSDALSLDELLGILRTAQAAIVSTQRRLDGLLLTQNRPAADVALDVGSWLVAIGGALAGFVDAAASGSLTVWGGTSLATGFVGMVLSAWVYQRRAALEAGGGLAGGEAAVHDLVCRPYRSVS